MSVRAAKVNPSEPPYFVAEDLRELDEILSSGEPLLLYTCGQCGWPSALYTIGMSQGGRHFVACVGCKHAYPVDLHEDDLVVFP